MADRHPYTKKDLSALEDRELIQLCLARESARACEAGWEEIVRRYRRKVFGIAYRFTGKYEEAEDLTQEIFFRVFRSLDRFDCNADFATWLHSVGRNHCIDHYRSGRRERECVIDKDVDFEAAVSGRFDPHRSLEQQDHKELLSRALQALPAKLREVVVLRDIHGLAYQEIVARLGLPEGTVKSRISRGRLELGRVLLAFRTGTPSSTEQTEPAGKHA